VSEVSVIEGSVLSGVLASSELLLSTHRGCYCHVSGIPGAVTLGPSNKVAQHFIYMIQVLYQIGGSGREIPIGVILENQTPVRSLYYLWLRIGVYS